MPGRCLLRRIAPWLVLVTVLVGVAVPRPTVAAKAGGRLVFAARQDIDTLDPHITNRAATRKILIQFMDTLVVIDPKDGSLKPAWRAHSSAPTRLPRSSTPTRSA